MDEEPTRASVSRRWAEDWDSPHDTAHDDLEQDTAPA